MTGLIEANESRYGVLEEIDFSHKNIVGFRPGGYFAHKCLIELSLHSSIVSFSILSFISLNSIVLCAADQNWNWRSDHYLTVP